MQAGAATRPPVDLGASTSCDEPSESTGLVASGSTAEDVIATKEGQVLEARPIRSTTWCATCKDTGQVADNYEGAFCDLPPGLAVSGAASRNGAEARINGNVINGMYDRHETTTCNGKPVYEHSGTFGTAGDGVVIYQPSGHDAIWVLAAGENAEEGAAKCAARGALFLLCSASSPAPVSGLSYTWRWVQADEITCANGIYEEAGSIRVVSTSADQEGRLGF